MTIHIERGPVLPLLCETCRSLFESFYKYGGKFTLCRSCKVAVNTAPFTLEKLQKLRPQ